MQRISGYFLVCAYSHTHLKTHKHFVMLHNIYSLPWRQNAVAKLAFWRFSQLCVDWLWNVGFERVTANQSRECDNKLTLWFHESEVDLAGVD